MSTSVFCPTCANLLLVEECAGGSGLRFCCATCPYVYNIDKTVRRAPASRSAVGSSAAAGCAASAGLLTRLTLTGRLRRVQITHVVPTHSKEVDDVLGGEEAWCNVDATAGARCWRRSAHVSRELTPRVAAAVCPKCSHNKAFFMQVQIRSGDEPMTTFYKARAPRRLAAPAG